MHVAGDPSAFVWAYIGTIYRHVHFVLSLLSFFAATVSTYGFPACLEWPNRRTVTELFVHRANSSMTSPSLNNDVISIASLHPQDDE